MSYSSSFSYSPFPTNFLYSVFFLSHFLVNQLCFIPHFLLILLFLLVISLIRNFHHPSFPAFFFIITPLFLIFLFSIFPSSFPLSRILILFFFHHFYYPCFTNHFPYSKLSSSSFSNISHRLISHSLILQFSRHPFLYPEFSSCSFSTIFITPVSLPFHSSSFCSCSSSSFFRPSASSSPCNWKDGWRWSDARVLKAVQKHHLEATQLQSRTPPHSASPRPLTALGTLLLLVSQSVLGLLCLVCCY